MAANLEVSDPLNEQQIMMLRLFKTPLSNEDFQQIRRLAVKLIAGKLDVIIDEWEKENTATTETYDQLAKGHFRSKQ